MKKKNKRKLRKNFKIFLMCFIITMTFLIFYGVEKKKIYDYSVSFIAKETEYSSALISFMEDKNKEYQNCLVQEYSDEEISEELENAEDDLTSYLQKYGSSLSVKFVDTTTSYTYTYNSNVIYYAASTIKMLDALYIYTNAYNGNLSLDDTVTYKSSDRQAYSTGMSTHNYGDKVTLRELVSYAILYSDNTAHRMLVNYIGYNTLKEFGRSLGATTTLSGYDNFGYINVTDSIIYVTKLYEFINSSGSLGEELLSYFINSDDNYLKNEEEGIKAATKYGEYSPYFHNNGIVYTENPYFISILTTTFKNDGTHKKIIANVNGKIQELQEAFYNNRISYCKNKVYVTE